MFGGEERVAVAVMRGLIAENGLLGEFGCQRSEEEFADVGVLIDRCENWQVCGLPWAEDKAVGFDLHSFHFAWSDG